jgi:hypothetical protein
MARKGTRKSGLRLTQRVWAPFGHAINATGNSVGEVTGTASNVVRRGLKGAKRLGNIWTRHANMAVKNVVSRRGSRKTRRNRRSRN